jgi:chaperonin GroEL
MMRPPRPPKPTRPKDFQTPKVVFHDAAWQGMQRGINQIANAIRPTLGPLPRLVALESNIRTSRPELLDSGGTIARRIIQIQERDADVGAMFLRHVLWDLQNSHGDGTATAAVLFQAIYNRGIRYIVAGGNALRLQYYLERATPGILDDLDRMSFRVEGKEALSQLAETICYDPPLARMLGEIFDIIGEFGRLEIRSGRGRDLSREYVEGMYWDSGLHTTRLLSEPQVGKVQLENAAVLISDLEIEEPQDLLPLLDLAVGSQINALLLVARKISDRGLSILLEPQNREKVQVVAVKTPGMTIEAIAAALEDMAILTGGQALIQAAGFTLSKVQPAHLGRARRAWANPTHFGIIGGKSDPRLLRQHIANLRQNYASAEDKTVRKNLLERLGKLLGGSATLWIGGISPISIEARKELAERTAEALRGAMQAGVLPGGGIALLQCRPALQAVWQQASDPDEQVAYRILLDALAQPFYTLLTNAGHEPGRLLWQIEQAGPGWGFDVRRQEFVQMAQAGICDSTSVTKAAVFHAIHSAALALTIDVLIHKKNPQDGSVTT